MSGAGLAAGVHSGLTYGLAEVRGTHDWTNSAVAGAISGAAVALTSEHASHEQAFFWFPGALVAVFGSTLAREDSCVASPCF